MKKIYILTLLMVFAVASFAQRTAIPGKKLTNVEYTKTPTDTLVPPSCLTGSPTLYSSTGGGYVCGPNGYGDVAKAQAFSNSATVYVEEALFWVGAKLQTATPGTVAVNLYDMTGTATTTVGTGQPGPGTILSTVPLAFDVIDTGLSALTGFNAVPFTTPSVAISSDFAIGLDFTNAGNDTLGIVSTTDLDATDEMTFDKWSDGTWHSFKEAGNWGLSLDMYIWAVLGDGTAGINDNFFFDGIKLSQNQPNPSNGSTMIQYELQNAGNVTLEIYDLTGRLVVSSDEGKQNAGQHNILIDSEKLNEGAYYYSLKADNHRLTKKMVVTK
ncbi:MAG: T9SS type A sorting domain-containing protein [Bacteroidota bacterium]